MIFDVGRPQSAILSASFDYQFQEASRNIRFFQLKCRTVNQFMTKIITAPRREQKNELGYPEILLFATKMHAQHNIARPSHESKVKNNFGA